MQYKKATKIALQLFIVTVFTKLIGFIREVAFGARFGTSVKADAFPLALQLPNILFASVFAAFSTSFIPFYTDIREKKGEDEGIKFTNSVINTLLLASSIVAILGFIFSKQLILLQVHQSKELQIMYASKILKITIFMIIFTSSTNILQGFLQANGNFTKPVLSSIPFNFSIFVAIFLSYFEPFKKFDIYIVAVGFVVGYFWSLVYQLNNSKKYGFKFYPVLGFKDENIKKMIKFSFPVFISSSMAQLYTFIDRYLLTGTSTGAVAAVAYAGKLNDVVVGVFSSSISVLAFSTLSNLQAKGDKENFRKFFVSAVNSIILMMMPFAIGGMIMAKEITRLIYQRGNFTTESTLLTASPLMFYCLGFVGLGLRDILNRTLYVLKDSKTAVKNGVIAIICNIILDVIFIHKFKHTGAAMAFATANYIAAVLLFISLRKKLGSIGWKRIAGVFVKAFVASLIMGVFVYVFKQRFIYLTMPLKHFAFFTTANILLGMGIYAGIIYLLKVEEVGFIVKMVREKFGV